MKEQRYLQLCRPLREVSHTVEPSQALCHVFGVVIDAVLLCVTLREPRRRIVTTRANGAPGGRETRPIEDPGLFSRLHIPRLEPVNWLSNQEMGRPSNREARRTEILGAFARVLADHGYAGATIAAVATEAEVAPGLIHYHFDDKEDLLASLLSDLVGRFRARVRDRDDPDPLLAYVDGALRLDDRADITAARCWVGLFSEAIRNPTLFKRMRSLIDAEVRTIQARSSNELDAREAGAVLAFIIGALVRGAFAPKKNRRVCSPRSAETHRIVEPERGAPEDWA